MEPTLFRYIFKFSKRQQVFLLILTCLSFPFLYAILELPKTIINEAIGGTDFPRELSFVFFGVEFAQIEYLLALSSLFLVLVFVNGGFKYWINVFKGQLGERMLRRLRYQLFSRVLRFPLSQFRRTSQGEIIAMLTAEGETLGGFFGDALAWPVFQGGTLLTILVFMFAQDWILGLAAIALYPVQMYIIPKLQRRVNALGKERVRTVRKLSERIGETISGIRDVHAHDTSEVELADFSSRVGTIFEIRYQIYRKKFFIKFLNNFLGQLTPFFFYSIGGYLVIVGDLTFGALVAILAAYKDLSGPWKELLQYYQMKEDARIKYEQLVEQFEQPGMLDEALQREEPEPIPTLRGTVVASNLTLTEEGGIKIVDGANFTFDASDSVAVLGASGTGRAAVAQMLARLVPPTAGTVRIGEINLANLPEAVTGRRIAYADEAPYFFAGSVVENLLYGLKHRPVGAVEYDDDGQKTRQRYVDEAQASGNTDSDPNADWTDYAAAGVDGPEGLAERTLAVLRRVKLDDTVYRFGLQGTVDPLARPDVAGRILEARETLHRKLKEDEGLARLIEVFDISVYNENMTVAENLLFGTPIGDAFDLDHMADNPHVRGVLEKVGLTERMIETGHRLTAIMVDLFRDLPPGHEYFERFSFISAEMLPEYQAVLRRVEANGLTSVEESDRHMLMSMTFRLVPARHRLGLLDEELRDKLLDARKAFAEGLPAAFRPSVAFFDASEYNAAASVQDNILFGRSVYGRPQGEQVVGQLVGEVVESLGLWRTVFDLGLDAPVGISGGRLGAAVRQRLALARCLIKRPDLLIVNGGVSALAPTAQSAIMKAVFEEMEGRGIVWILDRIEDVEWFEAAVVMESGRVARHGKVKDLQRSGILVDGSAAAE